MRCSAACKMYAFESVQTGKEAAGGTSALTQNLLCVLRVLSVVCLPCAAHTGRAVCAGAGAAAED